MWQTPAVVLISGIMAARKSTVAELLARRLPRAVHLRGDLFRRRVVTGRADMTAQPSAEAWRQLRLRYDLAALVADRLVSARASHAGLVRREIPELPDARLVLEPVRRNTAPAIALAALAVAAGAPDAVLLVLPSDQAVRDEEAFVAALRTAVEAAAAAEAFVTLGIRPTRAVRSRGQTLSLVIIFDYYLLLTLGYNLGSRGAVPAWVAMWLPNALYGR